MFTITNIIIIIMQIPYQSVSVDTRRLQPVVSSAFLKSELRPSSFSILRFHVVLGRPFGIFNPATGLLIAARKALRRSSSGEALATWPNKYNWFKWVRSPEKKLAWNRTCWCNSVLLKNASKLQLRNRHIHQQNISLNFVILSNLVFIYSRNSTSNFRLFHIFLDYKVLISTLSCYNIKLS